MEFSELTNEQLIAAASAIGFIAGGLLVHLLLKPRKKNSRSEDPRNHKIRELEADLRTITRKQEETKAQLEQQTADFNTSVDTLREVRASLSEADAELVIAKSEMRAAVKKTRELRQELQDRATESVREYVRAEEAQTELEVERAGSEAVMGEIARLQKERKHLTDSVRILGDQFIIDESLLNAEED